MSGLRQHFRLCDYRTRDLGYQTLRRLSRCSIRRRYLLIWCHVNLSSPLVPRENYQLLLMQVDVLYSKQFPCVIGYINFGVCLRYVSGQHGIRLEVKGLFRVLFSCNLQHNFERSKSRSRWPWRSHEKDKIEGKFYKSYVNKILNEFLLSFILPGRLNLSRREDRWIKNAHWSRLVKQVEFCARGNR